MSYMFTNGPFFHAGIKAELLGACWLYAGVANYTDQSTATTAVKTLLVQFSGSAISSSISFLRVLGNPWPYDMIKKKHNDPLKSDLLNLINRTIYLLS